MDITPGKETSAPKHASIYYDDWKHLFEGIHVQFPTFKHNHVPIVNVNQAMDEHLTLGQKVADAVAARMGSWSFIIGQALIMAIWIVLNLVGWFYHWDVYPFVLLNLAMSAQAAFATPLIMMSQNRQAAKDRLTAENDYQCDLKGEQAMYHIMEHLDHQDEMIIKILQRIEAQHHEMLKRFAELDPEMAKRLFSDMQQLSEDF